MAVDAAAMKMPRLQVCAPACALLMAWPAQGWGVGSLVACSVCDPLLCSVHGPQAEWVAVLVPKGLAPLLSPPRRRP